MSESDVQVLASRALSGFDAVGFTVLARPGDVRVLLLDHGCGADVLEEAADAVSALLGDAVYSVTGTSLQSVVIELAIARGARIAVAESCTGGMVAASLTEVAGSSAVLRGGLVTYDNEVKARVLGVDIGLLRTHGAVSEQCARAMAHRTRELFDVDVAVAVTGIAGPGGGSPGKPVGTVWFALSDPTGISAEMRSFSPTGREHIRARACSAALDLLRRAVRSQ
jgi:PncC family amidohydrolase